jgi:hypothetical protein
MIFEIAVISAILQTLTRWSSIINNDTLDQCARSLNCLRVSLIFQCHSALLFFFFFCTTHFLSFKNILAIYTHWSMMNLMTHSCTC